MNGVPPAVLLAALAGEARSARRLQRAGMAGVRRCTPGPGPAGAAASSLPDARLLVSWGCAGALHETLAPGDLLLPTTVIGRGGECFAVDAGLHARLSAVLGILAPRQGAVAEVARVVTAAGERRALALRTGAVAVDMETAAIARAATASGRPFVAIRAIADSTCLPLDRLPALSAGATRVLLGALRRPGCLPVLWRLALAYRRALHTLAQVAAILAAQPVTPFANGSGGSGGSTARTS